MSLQTLNIKMLVMDVDGVLTDGGIIIHEDGTESKRFHVHDGAWIRIWKRMGLQTAIITGRTCQAVEHRMRSLEVDYVYQGALKKLDVLDQLIQDSGVPAEKMAYIGDDIFDLPVMTRVGYGAVVPEAIDTLRDAADYVTMKSGGYGAVGELIIHLLKKMNLWEHAMERYRV